MSWRWTNVPLPEAHLVGLIAGTLLRFLAPQAIFPHRWVGFVLGGLLVCAGAALAGWAVLEASDMAIDAPDRLLTMGPYAWSRNPMFVGWTLITLGCAFLLNTVWLLVLLPLVWLVVHLVDVKGEEQRLEEQFGEEYLRYRARVRRYV